MARQKSESVSAGHKIMRVYEKLTNAVLDAGGTDEDVRRIDLEDGLAEKLAQLIVGEKEIAKPDFKIWRTLNLGTGLRTADDFRAALKQSDCRIGDYANDILGKPAFMASPTETSVDLVIVSVAELGFKQGATYAQICARAKELGLQLCPAEAGPQLRLQYLDQPLGEWLVIAMESISDSDGSLRVFRVGRRDDGLWLSSSHGDPGDVWNPNDRFVFGSRK